MIQFTPPSPTHIPNINENRSHNNTLGSLRSLPTAANWNRASSTAQSVVFVLIWKPYLKLSWWYHILHAWMWKVGCFTLGAKGRIECTCHFWCKCVTVSGLETTEPPKYKKIVTWWTFQLNLKVYHKMKEIRGYFLHYFCDGNASTLN